MVGQVFDLIADQEHDGSLSGDPDADSFDKDFFAVLAVEYFIFDRGELSFKLILEVFVEVQLGDMFSALHYRRFPAGAASKLFGLPGCEHLDDSFVFGFVFDSPDYSFEDTHGVQVSGFT